jgi:pimeloyl-ACP methyl ester carboxylesterase
MSTVTSKDGTKIAFDKIGSGPAVILVNGAMADRMIDPSLAKLADLLSKDFTVYNYDRRGRGESGDTQPFAKEREIEDIAELIEDADGADGAGSSAMVLGFSSGGALVLDAAQNVPGITKIALYEVPFIINDIRPPLPADYVAHLNGLVKEGKRDEAVRYFLVKAAGIPAEYLDGADQNPLWPRMLDIAHTIAYDGVRVAELMQGKPLPTDRWTRVTMPALVMAGTETPPKGWMVGAADAIAALLPNAERRTLEGQNHNVDMAIIAPIVAEFFS